MARITVEDCLKKENNRFALVQLAAKRTKQILGGSKSLVDSSNKAVVTALREIAESKVRFMTPEEAELARQQAEREQAEAAERQSELAALAQPPSPDSILISSDDASVEASDSEEVEEEEVDDEEDEEDLSESDDDEDDNGEDVSDVEAEESGPDRNGDGGSGV
ncbi:MAG: DNA-directed RNA polymerase subunit omega [Deltaproteobacteria bacterium]|nr:DNA-directed RNA polymerase subunit omega [Deltaproteobacteria bacterium]